MRRVSSAVAVSTFVLSACGSEPTSAPPAAGAERPPAVAAAMGGALANPTIAIDDALSRLIPALDAPTAALLTAPLRAVASALKSWDAAALKGAIAVARQALARPTAANDDRAPDLAAIALALDAAAAAN